MNQLKNEKYVSMSTFIAEEIIVTNMYHYLDTTRTSFIFEIELPRLLVVQLVLPSA